jgi:preprotein translocase SecE subunit
MADRKKNASRRQASALKARRIEKEQPVKSSNEVAVDEGQRQLAENAEEPTTSNGNKQAAVSNKSETTGQKKQSVKVAREERKETTRVATRSSRQSKGPSALERRIRSNPIGRFAINSYNELRHNVTWPTFEEARNMTIVVIVLSAIVGLILFLADSGLFYLFRLASGGS